MKVNDKSMIKKKKTAYIFNFYNYHNFIIIIN